MRTPQITVWVGLSLLLHLFAVATLPGPAVRPPPPLETVLVMEAGAPVHLPGGRPLTTVKAAPRAAKRAVPAASPARGGGMVEEGVRHAAPPPLPVLSARPVVPPSPLDVVGPGPSRAATDQPAAAQRPASPAPAGSQLPSQARGIQVESLPAPEQARQRYLKQHFGYVRDLVASCVVYPPAARRMNWSGRTLVAFIVTEEGAAEAIRVLETSGFPLLDKSALEAIRKASPYPKPPVRAQIVLPVTFQLSR